MVHYRGRQTQEASTNVENAVLGLVKLNALPPDAYDTRGPRIFASFMPSTTSAYTSRNSPEA